MQKGSDIIKVVKIILAILVSLCLLVILVLPCYCVNLSYSDSHMYSPFQMFTYVDITFNDPADTVKVQYQVPGGFSSLSVYGSKTSQATYYDYVMLSDGIEHEIYLEVRSDDPYPFTNVNDGRYVNSSAFSIENYNQYESFLSGVSIFFQDGYLSQDFGMYAANDGIIFSSTVPEFPNCTLYGEFLLPGEMESNAVSYSSSNGSIYLSYYQALYYSNVRWEDVLPDTFSDADREAWLANYQLLANVDFLSMSETELALVRDVFSWVGPLFGQFEIRMSDPDLTFSTSFTSFDLAFDTVLTSFMHSEDLQLRVVEDSSARGLTGFERVTRFLGAAVGGFFSVHILPGFSLGLLVVVLIAFSIVLWWLKVFAGG